MDNNFGVKYAVLLKTLEVFYRLRGPNIYSVMIPHMEMIERNRFLLLSLA